MTLLIGTPDFRAGGDSCPTICVMKDARRYSHAVIGAASVLERTRPTFSSENKAAQTGGKHRAPLARQPPNSHRVNPSARYLLITAGETLGCGVAGRPESPESEPDWRKAAGDRPTRVVKRRVK